jgi:hypothetical protein
MFNYYLFKLASTKFARDYLVIPRLFSKYPRISLPTVERYQKTNYDPTLGEFAVPTVRLWEMFPQVRNSSNTGVLGLAILSEYLQAICKIDSPDSIGARHIGNSLTLSMDGMIGWFEQNLKALGLETSVNSCELITETELNSDLMKFPERQGQIYF